MDCHTPFRDGVNGHEPHAVRPPRGSADVGASTVAGGPWGFLGSLTNTAWAGPWGVSFTANLTPDQNTGLGNWTEDMFVRAMREGKHMGTSRQILPPMPQPWYAKMTGQDLKAIYAYLRTIPAVSNHVPDPIPPAAPAAGSEK